MTRAQAGALERAVRRNEWERVALALLIALADAARRAPPGTIDDVLALLSDEEGRDDARRR
jgi:hypothetical protein